MEFNYNSWRIYYADESAYSNEDGKPEDAPCTGVVAVCAFNMDNRREIQCAKDYYIYDEQPIYKDMTGGFWYGADIAGLHQYLFRPGKKIVKFGALISDPTWRRMMARINQEWPEALPPHTKLRQTL